jgi:hypothetical protein
MHHGRILR